MNTIYAVAYMTEKEDGSKDLYVETIAASSRTAGRVLDGRTWEEVPNA